MRLRPKDWKCGEKKTLVEVIAPFGGAEKMVKDWKNNQQTANVQVQ
jgi:hemolysin-activating ACP:hemolysin acyltransferase